MEKYFVINMKSTSYFIGIDSELRVRHLYWGKKICNPEIDIPQVWDTNSNHSDLDNSKLEYTVFGGKMYRNCSFKCRYADACRDSLYTFKDAVQTANELVITMEDKPYNSLIKLHYIYSEQSDILTRYAEIINNSDSEIVLNKFMSCEISLPSELPYNVVNTSGSWGAEFQQEITTLKTGSVVYDSARGTTGHINQPTFIAYQDANEEQGEVYYAALGHSGNFKVEAQRDFKGITRAILGMNDFDFSYTLKAGESLCSPKVYMGYSIGFANMSNEMSAFAVENILPPDFAKKPLPVLYNSWEATGFDVNAENQLKLAKRAAEMGCELFVMDDGWFGERHDDHAGLGDWVVNKEKFPNGIDELIDGVNALGMDFGLWFEPEMVQKDSDLFRAHPDWIYHYPNRVNSESRNQLVLNITKEEVKEYMFRCMDDMVCNHNIKYIKWDMNRPLSEIGAENLENPQELWLRHSMAVYEVADRLKAKHPDLQLEACSSGGGRADLGALQHFDMVWTSDNTDPLDRLTIQNGFSQLYPIKCMRAWVTDWNSNNRPVSLDFRFNSSMQGSLSIGANLLKYSEDDLQKSKEYISLYKKYRNIIQFGKLYRLRNMSAHGYWATQYVGTDKNKSIVFVCSGADSLDNKHYKVLRLKGLDENTRYKFTLDGTEIINSGAMLMYKGIELNLYKPLDSIIIQIERI